MRLPRLSRWIIAVPVAGLLLLVAVLSRWPDGRLHLWVLDVGQGNALLLRSPSGHTAVIDGGPEATPLLEGIGRRLPFWQSRLDLVALTSPGADNVAGLVELLRRQGAAQVVQPRFDPSTGVQGAWRGAVGQAGAPLYHPVRGEVITLDGEPDVSLRVVYPPAEEPPSPEAAPIVMKVEYRGVSVLLAQSLEPADETRLLSMVEAGELESDVLLVPDHGNDTALKAELLAAVAPSVAIISVGAGNSGDDPSPATLERLAAAGVAVYRTDTQGTVEIIVDAEGRLWIASERK